MTIHLETFIEEIKRTGLCPSNNYVFECLEKKETNSTRKIMIDSELYRARIITGSEPINISKNYYGYDSRGSFVNPNTSQIKAMRANRAGQPRLYCADVNYLSMIEVKPEVGDKISLAKLRVNDVLTILDLTLFHIPYGMDEGKQRLFTEISALFSAPIITKEDESDYLVTQEIADFVESLGYDGIAYSSSLSPALNNENYNCCNFVIFNYSKCSTVKSNVMRMKSRHSTTSWDYDYSDFEQIDADKERVNLIGHKELLVLDEKLPSKKRRYKYTIRKEHRNIFVSTSRQIYHIPVKIFINKKELLIYVGKSFTITIPNNNHPSKTQFSLAHNLNSRINDLTLFFDALNEEALWFGDRENHRRGSFPIKLTEDYRKDGIALRRELIFCREIKKAFLQMNILFDINMVHLSDKDKRHIDIIRNCGLHNMILHTNTNEEIKKLQVLDVQGKKVFLVFEKLGDNQYKVFDYFSKTVGILCSLNHITVTAPQYSALMPIDLLNATNIDFNAMSKSYSILYNSSNSDLPLRANEDVWNILSAYDMSGDSRFLHLAESINEWVISTKYHIFKKNDYPYINKCLIMKRKGIFGDEERNKLKNIILTPCNNDLKCMTYILLEDFVSAQEIFHQLTLDSRKRLIELPIAYHYPNMKKWI